MKYKYYSTQRPVMPGTYPKPEDNPAMLIHNFEKREYVPESGGWRGAMLNMISR